MINVLNLVTNFASIVRIFGVITLLDEYFKMDYCSKIYFKSTII